MSRRLTQADLERVKRWALIAEESPSWTGDDEATLMKIQGRIRPGTGDGR